MLHPLAPSLKNYVVEAWHGSPKILELETPRPLRPFVIVKQKRAMVGEGRRKTMQHMGAESCISLGIAKKGVEFAQGRVDPFIAPSEMSILQVNFLQLTKLKGGSEAVDRSTGNQYEEDEA